MQPATAPTTASVVLRVFPSDPAYHRSLEAAGAFAVPAVAKTSVVAIKAILVGPPCTATVLMSPLCKMTD
jgi:hypothetical protein